MLTFSSSHTFPALGWTVSSIGTLNYDLALFLSNLLSPVVFDDYSCKGTFSFFSQIKNANFSGKRLVSYDVTGLATNIAVQETFNRAIKKNFKKNFSFLLHPQTHQTLR